MAAAAAGYLAHTTGSELSRDVDRLRGFDKHRLVTLVDVLWAHCESPPAPALPESPQTRTVRDARTIKGWKAVVADQLGPTR